MSLSYREEAYTVNRDKKCALSSRAQSCSKPLVNSSISQQSAPSPRTKAFFDNFGAFVIYRRDLKILKKFKCSSPPKSTSNKKKIDRFSNSSRRSLRFVAANCFPEIRSQILLTFHKSTPVDGQTVKQLLNSLLTRLRNKINCKYLWVMEFTRKGNPHIHLYLTCERTTEIHQYLAHTWNRICDETTEHLAVHLHGKNMVAWDMGSGAYVCKYLEKQYQKNVPDNFDSVGRFWSSSRNFVNPLSIESIESINKKIQPQINLTTGELPRKNFTLHFIYRTLRKYHEAKVQHVTKAVTGKKRKFRSGITKFTCSSISNASIIFNQIMEYLLCLHPPIPF